MGEAVTACGFCDQGIYRGKPCPYCKGSAVAPQGKGEVEWIEKLRTNGWPVWDEIVAVVQAAATLCEPPESEAPLGQLILNVNVLANALAALRSQVEGGEK